MEQSSVYYHVQNTNQNKYVILNNILQYMKHIVITIAIVLLIMILNKIIVKFYNYFKKIKKQIELHNSLINSLIENNDKKNLNFDEVVNEIKQHVEQKNKEVHKQMGNIEEMFYSETSKIIDCITNIDLIKNNIVNTNITTKINVLVKKINLYFEFFHDLDLVKGETYKKKLYFHLKPNRYYYGNGFIGFHHIDPYEITPLLMKYFDKYYDKTMDKFYPLDFQVFGGERQGTSLDWYDSEQERIAIKWQNNFKTYECLKDVARTINENEMDHIKFMNRNSIRLLDENYEEFEHKILQHILYELQDKYVIYKQIEFYTKK